MIPPGLGFDSNASERQQGGMVERAQADDSQSRAAEPFSLVVSAERPIPVLIAVPHAGRDYDPALMSWMREPEHSALKLEDRLVDRLAVDVATATGASLLIAHSPRAAIDLNRSDEDIDWSMIAGGPPPPVRHSLANRRSRSGLGLVPRRLPGMGEIWKGRISREELERRIEQIHRPYHRALAQEMDALCDRWGACLLLDFHSMPPLARHHPGETTAEFVIGDRFGASCHPLLAARALNCLSALRRSVAHNRPYSGGYVLERHGAPGRGRHALQIEICRSIYLERELKDVSPRSSTIVRVLSGLVRALAQEVLQLAGPPGRAIAAE